MNFNKFHPFFKFNFFGWKCASTAIFYTTNFYQLLRIFVLLFPIFTNFYYLLLIFINTYTAFTNFYYLPPTFINFYYFFPTFVLILSNFSHFLQHFTNFYYLLEILTNLSTTSTCSLQFCDTNAFSTIYCG